MKSHNVQSLKGLALTMVFGLVVVGLVAPRQADAISAIFLSDGSSSIIINDNSAQDLSPTVGSIAFTFLSASSPWNVLMEMGSTKPYQGSVAIPNMHLGLFAAGAGTLQFGFTDTDFINSTPSKYMLNSGGALNPTGATGSLSAYINGSNVLGGTTTLLAGFTPFGTGVSGLMPAGGPYSLTMVGTLTQSGGTSSFDATLIGQPVPEPASLLLLGSGLAGLGLWRRSRKNA